MSKITVEINEYACTTLEYIRKMSETGDYSQLPAMVERLQIHCNAMECGLMEGRDSKRDVTRILKNGDIDAEEKLELIKEAFKDED